LTVEIIDDTGGDGVEDRSAPFFGDVVVESSEPRDESGRWARYFARRVEVFPPNMRSDRRL